MKSFGEEFDKLGKELLGALHNVPQRDAKAAAAGRQHYMQQVDGYLARGHRPIESKSRWAIFANKGFATMAVTAMLVFVMIVSSVGVAAAQNALPGGTLYAVKTFGEDLRLAFTAKDSAELEVLGQFVIQRYEEIDALQAKGEPVPDSVAARLGDQLGTMLRTAAKMSGEDMDQALGNMQTIMATQGYTYTWCIEGGGFNNLTGEFGTADEPARTRDNWDGATEPPSKSVIEATCNAMAAIQMGLTEPAQYRSQFAGDASAKQSGKLSGSSSTILTDTITTTVGITTTQFGPGPGTSQAPGGPDFDGDGTDDAGLGQEGDAYGFDEDDELPYGQDDATEQPGNYYYYYDDNSSQEQLKKHEGNK